MRVAIVASLFHEPVTRRLVQGAHAALLGRGVRRREIETFWVPGAFEIPPMVQRIARRRARRVDAIVAVGCIVKGETDHHEHLASAVIDHLLAIARSSEIPVGLGVVTVRNSAQALARAGGARGNRGADGALAALEMVAALARAGR